MIRTLIFQKSYFICFNDNALKMMKDAFCFVLKAPLVPKIFNFFSCFFLPCRKNGYIRKIWLTSKFLISQSGKQNIAMHILPDVSQNKSNKTMKFGQHIEYKRKWVKEINSRPLSVFLKKLFNKVNASGLECNFNILP